MNPPTFNFYIKEPNKKFELLGFGSIDAFLDGLNTTIKGKRNGKNILKLNGDLFTWDCLKTRISGVIMGDRVYNFYDKMTIKDYKNKIKCVVSLQDELKENLITKIFTKKVEIQYDEATIEILKYNPDNKKHDLVAKGFGSWLGQIYFGDKCFWSVLDQQQEWSSDQNSYIIPSDGRLRKDLQCVLNNDIEHAQIEKEHIEQMEKTDQKLRDNYAKKINKH